MRGGPLPATNDLQHLLGAVEALGGRVPDLVDYVLRRAVALGVGGHLFLLGGEFHPLQLLLELTHVEVTQVHACPPLSSLSRPMPGLPKRGELQTLRTCNLGGAGDPTVVRIPRPVFRVRLLFGKGAAGYEVPAFSASPPLPSPLSQSSYFWPLGMVAPSRDPHSASCASVKSAPFKLAPLRLALVRSAPLRLALLRSASLRPAPL